MRQIQRMAVLYTVSSFIENMILLCGKLAAVEDLLSTESLAGQADHAGE